MNNLVSIILSVAFLAVSIPSAFAAGDSCATDTFCLVKYNNQSCCLQDYNTGNKNCTDVSYAIFQKTEADLKKYNGTTNEAAALQTVINNEDPKHFKVNVSDCILYNRCQILVAQGGIPYTIPPTGK